jgi:hypothetical protein
MPGTVTENDVSIAQNTHGRSHQTSAGPQQQLAASGTSARINNTTPQPGVKIEKGIKAEKLGNTGFSPPAKLKWAAARLNTSIASGNVESMAPYDLKKALKEAPPTSSAHKPSPAIASRLSRKCYSMGHQATETWRSDLISQKLFKNDTVLKRRMLGTFRYSRKGMQWEGMTAEQQIQSYREKAVGTLERWIREKEEAEKVAVAGMAKRGEKDKVGAAKSRKESNGQIQEAKLMVAALLNCKSQVTERDMTIASAQERKRKREMTQQTARKKEKLTERKMVLGVQDLSDILPVLPHGWERGMIQFDWNLELSG